MGETVTVGGLEEYINCILEQHERFAEYREVDYTVIESELIGMEKLLIEKTIKRDSFKRYATYYNELRKKKWDRKSDADEMRDNFNRRSNNNTLHSNMRHSITMFYRGQYDGSEGLRTGVYRGKTYRLEDYLYHEMLTRCAKEFSNTTHIEKLSIMQHYGCPTRLLDITTNPLVALYFACINAIYVIRKMRG